MGEKMTRNKVRKMVEAKVEKEFVIGACRLLGAIFGELPRWAPEVLPEWYCIVCKRKLKNRYDRFCSEKCRQDYYYPQLTCLVCGRKFRKERSQVYAKRSRPKKLDGFFCSRQCMGHYAASHWGFKPGQAHPRPRKYDYNLVWKIRQDTGWGVIRISRLLGIPKSSVSCILAQLKAEPERQSQPSD